MALSTEHPVPELELDELEPGPSPEETAEVLEREAEETAKREAELAELAKGATAAGVFPDGGVELAPGLRTEYAIRLLCAWTLGKPEQADEVLQGLAVVTVDQIVTLTGGK